MRLVRIGMTGRFEMTLVQSSVGRPEAVLAGLSETVAAGVLGLEPPVDWELGIQ